MRPGASPLGYPRFLFMTLRVGKDCPSRGVLWAVDGLIGQLHSTESVHPSPSRGRVADPAWGVSPGPDGGEFAALHTGEKVVSHSDARYFALGGKVPHSA